MRIGICDDSRVQRKILNHIIINGNYIDNIEIQEYSSALEIIEQMPRLDILFLDIEMPKMTGMELMRQYPNIVSEMKVIFFTSDTDYILDGYEVNAYRYLTKPVKKEKLKELFESIKKTSQNNNKLFIQSNGINVEIPYADILYFVANNNYVEVVTENKTWKYYKSLKDIELLVPHQLFYRTHKSFIVNMKHIKKINIKKNIIIMDNNEEVYVAIRHMKTFERTYMKFLIDNES